jgi:uncharacterized protein DUF3147
VLIKVNLRALRQTQAHEYLTRFVLGGLVTAIAGYLASEFGPVVGGLFLAFPAIYPASATLLDQHERARKLAAGIPFTIRGRLAAALDARGAALGGLGGIVFALLVWKMRELSVGATLLTSLVGWLVVSSLAWYVRRLHPCARRRLQASAP